MKKIQWKTRISFVLLVLLALTAVFTEPASGAERKRRFYLTTGSYDGAHALQACASGFHMASLWEIYDVSNLRYATTLGLNNTDSGFGPPSGLSGWIRTGYTTGVSGVAGGTNCLVWTTNNALQDGTIVQIPFAWGQEQGLQIGLWLTGTDFCSNDYHVWCVQN